MNWFHPHRVNLWNISEHVALQDNHFTERCVECMRLIDGCRQVAAHRLLVRSLTVADLLPDTWDFRRWIAERCNAFRCG